MNDIRDEMRNVINLLESIIDAKEGFVPQQIQDPHARSRLNKAKTQGYSSADAYAADQIPEWPVNMHDPVDLRNRVQSKFNMFKREWENWVRQGLIEPAPKKQFDLSKYL